MSRPTTPTSEFFSNFEGFLKKFKLTTENHKDQEILTLANLDSGRIRKFIVKKVDERSLFGRRNSQKSSKDENENKSRKLSFRKKSVKKEKKEEKENRRKLSTSSLHSLKASYGNMKRFGSSKSLTVEPKSFTPEKKKRRSSFGSGRFKLGWGSSSEESESDDMFEGKSEELSVPEKQQNIQDPGFTNDVLVSDQYKNGGPPMAVEEKIQNNDVINENNNRMNDSDNESMSSLDSESPSSSPRFNLKMSPVPKRSKNKRVEPQYSPVSFRGGYQSNRSSISSVRKGILKKTNSSTTINMEMNNLSRPQTPTENKSVESFEDAYSNGDTTRFTRSGDNPHLRHQRSFNRVKFILDSGRPDNITGDYDDIKIEKNDKSDRGDKGKIITNSSEKKLTRSGRKCLIFSAGLLIMTMAVILGSFYGSRKTPKALAIDGSNVIKYVGSAYEGKFTIMNENFVPALYTPTSDEFKKLSKVLEVAIARAIFHDETLVNGANSTIKLKVVRYEKGSVVCNFRIKWLYNEEKLEIPEIKKRVWDHLEKYGAFGDYKIERASFNIEELRDQCTTKRCSHICVLSDENLKFVCVCPDELILANATACLPPKPSTTTAKNPVNIPPIINKLLKVSNADLVSVHQEIVENIAKVSEDQSENKTLLNSTSEIKLEAAKVTEKANTSKDDSKHEGNNSTVSEVGISNTTSESKVNGSHVHVHNATTKTEEEILQEHLNDQQTKDPSQESKPDLQLRSADANETLTIAVETTVTSIDKMTKISNASDVNAIVNQNLDNGMNKTETSSTITLGDDGDGAKGNVSILVNTESPNLHTRETVEGAEEISENVETPSQIEKSVHDEISTNNMTKLLNTTVQSNVNVTSTDNGGAVAVQGSLEENSEHLKNVSEPVEKSKISDDTKMQNFSELPLGNTSTTSPATVLSDEDSNINKTGNIEPVHGHHLPVQSNQSESSTQVKHSNMSSNDSVDSIVSQLQPHSDGVIAYDILKFSNSSDSPNATNPIIIVTLPTKLPEVDPTLNEVSITEHVVDNNIQSPHFVLNSSETVSESPELNELTNISSVNIIGVENKVIGSGDSPIEFANITDKGVLNIKLKENQIYTIEENTNEINPVKETSPSENGDTQDKISGTYFENPNGTTGSQNPNDSIEIEENKKSMPEQIKNISSLINTIFPHDDSNALSDVEVQSNEGSNGDMLHITPTTSVNVSTSNCNIGQLECRDGSCYSGNLRCDSVLNCLDFSDEEGCLRNDCFENFQCKTEGLCLERKFVCDGVNHCTDGEDEKDCENRECSSDEFQCGSGDLCIPVTLRCDGYPDCSNRADEINCSSDCPKESFLCPEKTCIPRLWLCDGNPDCMNGEDENNCDCEGLDQSPCSVGGCVASFKLCDGLRQCPDGSDEWNCLQIDNTTHQLRVRSGGERWSAVCGDNWTVEWTELVCEQLGLGSSLSTEFVTASSSALLPRMMLSLDAADISRRRRAPLQYFLTHSECSNDTLVSISCKKQECGNWSVNGEEGISDLRSTNRTQVWPSLGILMQPRSNSSGIGVECAASVITQSWVLTSYSCLISKSKGLEAEEWAFMIGSLKPKLGHENIQLRYVKQIVIYPGVKRWKSRWIGDGALIRLQTPLKFALNVRPVCLPKQEETFYHDCVIVSWSNIGRSNLTADKKLTYEVTQSLQKTNLTDIEVCNSSIYGGLLSEHHLCASFYQDKYSSCSSHEGSPLMCQNSKGLWNLRGLLSHTGNCASFNLPSVFTDVEAVDYWISNTIGLSTRREKLAEDFVKLPTHLPSSSSSYITTTASTTITTNATTTTTTNTTSTLNMTTALPNSTIHTSMISPITEKTSTQETSSTSSSQPEEVKEKQTMPQT